jgi:hypothetical protein
MKMEDFYLRENRFKMLTKTAPEHAKDLWGRSQVDTDSRWALYNYMASRPVANGTPPPAAASAPTAPVAHTNEIGRPICPSISRRIISG